MIHFLAFCVALLPALVLAERANKEKLRWPVWALMLYGHITMDLSMIIADVVEAVFK